MRKTLHFSVLEILLITACSNNQNAYSSLFTNAGLYNGQEQREITVNGKLHQAVFVRSTLQPFGLYVPEFIIPLQVEDGIIYQTSEHNAEDIRFQDRNGIEIRL